MTQNKTDPWKLAKIDPDERIRNPYLQPDPKPPKEEERVQEKGRIISGKYNITQQQNTYK